MPVSDKTRRQYLIAHPYERVKMINKLTTLHVFREELQVVQRELVTHTQVILRSFQVVAPIDQRVRC